jgi:hypothetical protein
MTAWLQNFNKIYQPKLTHRKCNRSEGFSLIFQYLLECKEGPFEIIETGTLRNPGNWKDGQSTFLFSLLVDDFGGSIKSVDLNEEACTISKNFITSPNVTVSCANSLVWLNEQDLKNVDFFYLDSYDVDYSNDVDSAEHHLQEFLIIEPNLKENSIVAIDDNIFLNDIRAGKGRKIYEYLATKNIFPKYDKYQIIYIF